MKNVWILGLLLGVALGCGDDDAGTDADVRTDSAIADSGAQDSALGDTGETADGGTMDAGAMDAGPVVDLARFLVGHLGGTLALYQFDSPTATPRGASPVSVGTYNDIAAGGGMIALTLPGDGTVAVLSGDTLMPAMTPLMITPTPLTVAIDGPRGRLYVYAAAGASNRQIHGFDLQASTFVPMAGSPYDVDVVANELRVDPTTGDLLGVSSSTAWIGRIEGGVFSTLFGTPTEVDAGSIVVDDARRRVYYTSRFPSQLHSRSLDDWEPVAGSPLALPGEFPTSLDLSDDGDIFVLDGSSLGSGAPTTLVRATAAPFALAMACGSTDGCTLAESETGLAIDRSEERLYVTVVRGEESDGSIDIYDISTPEMPTEVTLPSAPVVGPLPAWIVME